MALLAESQVGVTAVLPMASQVAAIGADARTSYPGWMSLDSEDWSPVHPDYGFAVRSILVEGGSAMMFKSARTAGGMKDPATGEQSPPAALPTVTVVRPAMPNPFNPQTTLSFSLKEDAMVDLAVFMCIETSFHSTAAVQPQSIRVGANIWTVSPPELAMGGPQSKEGAQNAKTRGQDLRLSACSDRGFAGPCRNWRGYSADMLHDGR